MSTAGRTAAILATLLLTTACTAGQGERARRASAPAKEASSEECSELREMIVRTRRGYVPVRSADIAPIPSEPHYIGKASLPVHTGPWDYLAEVPLVFYGPGVVAERGRVERATTLADLAPITARLIGTGSFEAPDGRPDAALLASSQAPRVVLTIVWDGAGWNTLREHPHRWPTLRRLMSRGSSYVRATIGSTPSNTPPIHTTIGTGAFPRTHGIPHVKIRTSSGGYVDPFEGDDASAVRVPTLADVYDPAAGNTARIGVVATVNWHLGMIGHGAEAPGGDHDTAVLLNDQGSTYGNQAIYDIPAVADPAALVRGTDRLDRSDGSADGRWKEDDLTDSAIRYATPAFTHYQQQVLERVITEQGFGADDTPDLLYVNFKQIDDAGHRWGMTSRQVGDNVAAADDALARLIRFLDVSVGRKRWAVAVTADHGQTPYPEESGAWPIAGNELNEDIERAFADDGVEVVRVTSAGVFLSDRDALVNGTAQRVAQWLADYTVGDNIADGDDVPAVWQGREDERLFSAVLAGREVAASICDEASGRE